MQKILLIEDQPENQIMVRSLLEQRYTLVIAGSATEALQLAGGADFDLVLLDVALPDGDGFHLFTKLRELPTLKDVPIVFLTGKNEVADRVAGFSLGADDYVVKPFEPLEFRARIAAKLQARLDRGDARDVIRKGRLHLDRAMFKAFIADPQGRLVDLNLTPHEFRLLICFVANAGQVLSRDRLMTSVWGDDVHVLERTIDRHVSSLRRKLDPGFERIEAVHGVGYRFSLAEPRKVG